MVSLSEVNSLLEATLLLESSYVPSSRIFAEPTEVIARLLDLDPTLDQEVLLEANMRGYEARLEATPLHAPTAAGTYHWHSFVASLREALVQRGWSTKDHKNCPFVISPDKSVSILVMTGDVDTGVVEKCPANQADKGAVLNEAVQQNRQYELFENAAISALQRGQAGTQLWVLLYHVERDGAAKKEIRTELSLPSRFEKKKILEWSDRIILRSMPLDQPPVIEHAESTETIDIPVERKRAG